MDPSVNRLNTFGKSLRQKTFTDSRRVFKQQVTVSHQTDDQIADDTGIAFEDFSDIFFQTADDPLHGVKVESGRFRVFFIVPLLRSVKCVRIVVNQHDTADLNGIHVFQFKRCDRTAIDKGPIGTVQVGNRPYGTVGFEFCMTA